MKRISLAYAGRVFSGQTVDELRLAGVPEDTIIAAAKEDTVAQLYIHAGAKVNQQAGMYAPHEAARWTKLVAECEEFAASGTISSYLAALDLSAEALNAYAGGVLAKAAQFETRLAQITKQRDVHSAAINALLTPEEALAYDITAGW